MTDFTAAFSGSAQSARGACRLGAHLLSHAQHAVLRGRVGTVTSACRDRPGGFPDHPETMAGTAVRAGGNTDLANAIVRRPVTSEAAHENVVACSPTTSVSERLVRALRPQNKSTGLLGREFFRLRSDDIRVPIFRSSRFTRPARRFDACAHGGLSPLNP